MFNIKKCTPKLIPDHATTMIAKLSLSLRRALALVALQAVSARTRKEK